jgi:hypothetical protein
MAVTAVLYDHAVKKIIDGEFPDSDTFRVNLYSAFTPNVTHTTLAAVEGAATQLSTANGYTQNTKALASPAYSITGTNDGKFDAEDITWTATTGAIGAATHALIYDDTQANDPPLMYIAFGTGKTADPGTDFKITWATGGIIRFTYT